MLHPNTTGGGAETLLPALSHKSAAAVVTSMECCAALRDRSVFNPRRSLKRQVFLAQKAASLFSSRTHVLHQEEGCGRGRGAEGRFKGSSVLIGLSLFKASSHSTGVLLPTLGCCGACTGTSLRARERITDTDSNLHARASPAEWTVLFGVYWAP